ncbi:MAG: PIN domain-containing protein [Actinomycetota bacterium]
MTTILDTNVLVRHLTGDPPAQARRATSYLRSATDIVLLDVVLAELAYVLKSVYETPRKEVANAARSTLTIPGVRVMDIALLRRAIELYEVGPLSFEDAYIVAASESWGVGSVASFDRAFDRISTVTRVEP